MTTILEKYGTNTSMYQHELGTECVSVDITDEWAHVEYRESTWWARDNRLSEHPEIYEELWQYEGEIQDIIDEEFKRHGIDLVTTVFIDSYDEEYGWELEVSVSLDINESVEVLYCAARNLDAGMTNITCNGSFGWLCLWSQLIERIEKAQVA